MEEKEEEGETSYDIENFSLLDWIINRIKCAYYPLHLLFLFGVSAEAKPLINNVLKEKICAIYWRMCVSYNQATYLDQSSRFSSPIKRSLFL